MKISAQDFEHISVLTLSGEYTIDDIDQSLMEVGIQSISHQQKTVLLKGFAFFSREDVSQYCCVHSAGKIERWSSEPNN